MTEVFEVVLRWGDTILDVQYVHDPPAETKLGLVDVIARRTTLPPRSLAYARTDDRKVLPYIGVALVAHLALWGVAASTPPREQPVAAREPRPRVTRIAGEPQYTPPDDERVDTSQDTKAPGAGAAMKREQGRAGRADQRAETGHIAVESKAQSPQIARSAALEQARSAGILGSSATTLEQLKTLTGSADLSSGFDGATVTSNVMGGDGAAHGSFGLAYSGERHGGGGAWDTVGVGEYRGLSNGEARDPGWGGELSTETIRVIPWIRIRMCSASDDCVNFGDLDQRIILRYTRRKSRQLINCWTSNYGSSKQMIVDFKIERSGRVKQISAPLGCIEDIYKSIRFPRSRDIGTQVRHVLEFEVHKTHY